MQGLEKILQHIKEESENQCREIAIKANKECERIRTEYSKREQEEYWSYVNNGSKDIEQRIHSLTDLASDQARKMLRTTQEDMLDAVLAITARKLSALPSRTYNEILKKLDIEEGCKPEYLIEHFRDDLTPSVTAALFD
ncbi:MAG: hypothetical protein LBC71_00930 [Oscillospiraceae bacterium]|jgi:vacuolar-type H+-ATPase subunit E/Vma4|nr:hypothetical protein [Oscillospiraceae bacterium]